MKDFNTTPGVNKLAVDRPRAEVGKWPSYTEWGGPGEGEHATLIDVEEAYPVQASPAQVRNLVSSMVWPYFPGDRQQRTVFIRDLADPRIVVVEPIPVSLEVSDGQPTACCYDLEQFGIGDDEFSALDDLRATIVELYFALKGEQSLGPLPQRQLAYLRSVVREA